MKSNRKKLITIKQRLYLSLVGVFLLILTFGVANLLHVKLSVANLIQFDQPVTPEIVHKLLQEHTYFIVVSLVLILIVLIITGTLTLRAIFKEIGAEPEYIADIAQRIAEGDLSFEIQTAKNDNNSVLRSIFEMRESLLKIITDVRSGMDHIFSAANEIAIGNKDLARRTIEEAQGLESTATAIGQLTVTVKQNTDNAHQANSLSHSASNVAQKGGEAVAQVIDVMEKIQTSSQRIEAIISVIDGIAFQTNILALNAAVEAARAGESGKGFAVVATEVRNLAQRSAAAAKEIQQLIDESVNNVQTGNQLVNHAGVTMKEIQQSVDNVTNIIASISQASEEQSSGIDQINQVVLKMEQRTQQNSSLVDHAANAATSMQDQSAHLAHLISQFKVNASTKQHTPALKVDSSLPIMPISDILAVAPQLGPDDMQEVARAGFKGVIINLPDFEINQYQPTADSIIQQAKAHGLTVKYQPVVGSKINAQDVAEFGGYLKSLPHPILAFCRSGKRCTKMFNLLTNRQLE